jgi:hypothetical protein
MRSRTQRRKRVMLVTLALSFVVGLMIAALYFVHVNYVPLDVILRRMFSDLGGGSMPSRLV